MNNSADGLTAGVSVSGADALMTQNTFYNNVSNRAQGSSGALALTGSAFAALFYNTLIENSGGSNFDGSIFVGSGASMDALGNIIFSASQDDTDCRLDFQAVYQSQGHNIDGDGSCGGHVSDAITANPNLNPIDMFGGTGSVFFKYTMPPMANSIAVDFGPANNCTAAFGANLTQDQRDMTKPVDGNGDTIVACDAGATEYQPDVDPKLPILTVEVSGTGSVDIAELGETCSAICSYAVTTGATLTLTPVQQAGQGFQGFSGVCAGQNPCQFVIQSDETVGATFTSTLRQLSVVVNGSGSVVSTPAGINCSDSCNAQFELGQTVGLQATAEPGWEFSHWSGSCSGVLPNCDVSISGAKSTTAHFDELPEIIRMTVEVVGGGVVDIAELSATCSSTCYYDVEEGTVLTLTPSAATGQDFDSFSGVCAGQDPCQVTMQANQTVSATFVPQQRQLLVTVVGDGNVSSTPAGINCSGSCSATYNYNDEVNLQAQAESGWEFSHWSGVCSGSSANCSVTLSSNKTTTAHFEEISTEEVIFSTSFED